MQAQNLVDTVIIIEEIMSLRFIHSRTDNQYNFLFINSCMLMLKIAGCYSKVLRRRPGGISVAGLGIQFNNRFY